MVLVAGNTFGQPTRGKLNLDSLLQRQATAFLKQAPFAALSIGLIQNGKTHFYNYGTTQPKSKQLPTASTGYEIGSISKTFTGTLLAQAVIEGKLNLDDDIRRYMTQHYPNLAYQGHPIRLVHLLNHSSGLPFNLPIKPSRFSTSADSTSFEQHRRKYIPEDFFTDLHQVKLDTVPGIKLSYSNAAAQLLGYILEGMYHMPYEQLIQAYICRPLKMSHTQARLSKPQRLQGHNGTGVVMPYAIPQELAAAGIWSTTADLLRYVQWHMDESQPIVQLTHQPTWGDIRYYAMGLNWQMDDKAPMPRRIFQSGSTLGFSSFLVFQPDLKRGVVLLTNVSDLDTQGQLSAIAKEMLLGLDKDDEE
ncbi:serine hydrolase domain-containing protein [Spirosoma knui]